MMGFFARWGRRILIDGHYSDRSGSEAGQTFPRTPAWAPRTLKSATDERQGGVVPAVWNWPRGTWLQRRLERIRVCAARRK
jgi:hypothetical protein